MVVAPRVLFQRNQASVGYELKTAGGLLRDFFALAPVFRPKCHWSAELPT